MPIFISSPPSYTPAVANTWEDIDDANVPDGATGVILRASNVGGQGSVYVRKNGSTDGFIGGFIRNSAANAYVYMYVGVDGSGIFEFKGGSTTYSKIEIMGYFTEGTFFTNAVVKTTTTTDVWEDIDISSDTGADTAIGAVFIIDGGDNDVGIRKNGSTDTATVEIMNANGGPTGFIVGVDGSEICEGFRKETNDFNLMGYFETGEGVTFNTNGTDLTPSGTGYETETSSGDAGSILLIGSANTWAIDARPGDSSATYYYDSGTVFLVGVDSSNQVDIRIETTSAGISALELGYFTSLTTPANDERDAKLTGRDTASDTRAGIMAGGDGWYRERFTSTTFKDGSTTAVWDGSGSVTMTPD